MKKREPLFSADDDIDFGDRRSTQQVNKVPDVNDVDQEKEGSKWWTHETESIDQGFAAVRVVAFYSTSEGIVDSAFSSAR